MKPFTIQALERGTGEVVVVAKIKHDGSATTESSDEVSRGLTGPFATIAFHVGHAIVGKKFKHMDELPSLRESLANGSITDGDIAANIPEQYRGYDFIQSK